MKQKEVKKRLCIDINSLIPLYLGRYGGVARTTLDLIRSLDKMKDNIPFEIILYSQNMKGIKGENFDFSFKSKHLYVPNRKEYNEILKTIPLKELFLNYDLMHIPHNYDWAVNPQKTVITLHDALFFSYPEEFLGHDYARKYYPKLAQACKGIVTCSQSSKNDIVKYMNVPEEKVTVIYWGISNEIFFPESDENVKLFKEKYQIRNPYFTMVSCVTGRKNTISLIRSFSQYRKEGGKNDLVLLWKNPPLEILKEFAEEINEKQIHFLSGLNEVDLRCLYSGAASSFFPSKYEGFGLPVLESLACGTPVVTCSNSSLGEIGGTMAFYTEPEDLDKMSQYMLDFESNKESVFRAKDEMVRYAGEFSWEKTAKKYVEFYNKYI